MGPPGGDIPGAREVRVLVCGGRNYNDRERLNDELDALDKLHGPLFVLQGGATGADRMAMGWCARWLPDAPRPCQTFFAEWSKYGRAAGPMRNQRMIDEGRPDLVLAFPGGRGTADMVRRAKLAGVPVKEI